ncbi:MAG TPA: gamma-glutamylcyclotransferase [Pyrinomonadaceae bacterium]|jgi:gamma-glutamylcyclotransferase (GGCT)/AIG2-like uncharacterized protein YtfP|nr:gamma-glutamylcyclotransferase [Pyrinomonadaceae bacterium]
MGDLSLPEVERLVATANAVRQRHAASGGAAESDGRRAEQRLDILFMTGHRLAVYGTLAPGQPNHHVVAPLGGEWTEGLIVGELLSEGWGAALGYPAFRPQAGGVAVAVQVLTTPALATAWPALDRFEGPEYRRILVPVFSAVPSPGQTGERRLLTVANLYAMTEASPATPRR